MLLKFFNYSYVAGTIRSSGVEIDMGIIVPVIEWNSLLSKPLTYTKNMTFEQFKYDIWTEWGLVSFEFNLYALKPNDNIENCIKLDAQNFHDTLQKIIEDALKNIYCASIYLFKQPKKTQALYSFHILKKVCHRKFPIVHAILIRKVNYEIAY